MSILSFLRSFLQVQSLKMMQTKQATMKKIETNIKDTMISNSQLPITTYQEAFHSISFNGSILTTFIFDNFAQSHSHDTID